MRAFLFCLLLVLASSVQAQDDIVIQLSPGYNLISSNIMPPEEMFEGNQIGPDVPLMFEQLRGPDGDHLASIVKDVNGRFYAPRFGFCNIPFWNLEQGLSVLVMEDTQVAWAGERIPADTEIQLTDNWNLIAYYPEYNLNANSGDFYALSPIIDNVIIAKDETGSFMLPGFDFSNMNPWTQGEAYFLRAVENGVLSYPEEREEDPVIFEGGDHWGLDVTGDVSMNVLVSVIGGPDGFEPGEGDQIGAFSNFGDFVGYGDIFGNNCGVAVWGLDQNFGEIPGLDPGDAFSLIYWDDDLESEFFINIEEVVEGRGLTFMGNGFTIIEIFVEAEIPGRDQVVPLGEGWNMISINVVPNQDMWEGDQGPDILLMLEQLVEADNLELMKNENGRFYSPEFGFNDIQYWDFTQGYLVKVIEACECTWSGEPIPFDNEIPLGEGWNLIAYYPECDLNADSPGFYVLSPIIDNVLLAKNGNGEFMTPAFEFSSMPPWTAGQGYQVNVDADVVLQYPEPQEEENARFEPVESPAVGIPATDNNMSLLVTSFKGVDLSSGNQIRAYSSDSRLVGVGDISDDNCGIAIWGAETGEQGLQPGQSFELRLWDANQQIETDLSVSAIHQGDGLTYEIDGFSAIEVAIATTLPDSYFLSGAYPNPFNNRTTVKYGLPENGMVNMAIYSLSGRKVLDIAGGEQSAGTHELDINCTDLTSGIYVLTMNANRMNFTQKLVLVK
ncbi:MAG: T9SS type A sorting domain-containing protein [Calditrichaeota bacterium]|jgi:hypothetical protein|nr:T9SS type A sorting domain-containing protein [Calditrichota bacterium]